MHLLLIFVLIANACLVESALIAQPTLFSEGESDNEEGPDGPTITTTSISPCSDMIGRCYEQYGIGEDLEEADKEALDGFYGCIMQPADCSAEEETYRHEMATRVLAALQEVCPECDSPVVPSSEPEQNQEPESVQDPMACYNAIYECHEQFNEAYTDYEPVAEFHRCLDSIDICYGAEEDSRQEIMDSLFELMRALCPDCHEETTETPIPIMVSSAKTPQMTCFELVTVCRDSFDSSQQHERDMQQMHTCLLNINASHCEAWEETYRQDSIDWIVNEMVASTSPSSSATAILTTQQPMTCAGTIEACKKAFEYSPGNSEALISYQRCLLFATKCSSEENRQRDVTLTAIQDALDAYDTDGWANRGRPLVGSLMLTLVTLTLSLWLLKG